MIDDDEEDKIESESITGDGEATKENDVSNSALSDENVIETTEILKKINDFDLHSDLFSSDESEDEERDEDTTNDEVKKINSNAEQEHKTYSVSPAEFKENLSNVTYHSTSSHENVIETKNQDTKIIAQQEKGNSNITKDNEVKNDTKVLEPDQNNENESEDFDIPSDDLFDFESEDEDFDDDTSDNEVEKTTSTADDKKVEHDLGDKIRLKKSTEITEEDADFVDDTSDNEVEKTNSNADDKNDKQDDDKIRRKKSTEITEQAKLRAERNKDRVCTCGYTRELKEKVEIKREGSWKVYFKKKVFSIVLYYYF